MSFDKSKYVFKLGEHRGKAVIWVQFPYDLQLKDTLRKSFPHAKWSNTNKSWYVADNDQVRQQLDLPPKMPSGKQIITKIDPVNRPAFRLLIEQLQLKAYSLSTIKTYSVEFAQLLYFLEDQLVDNITPQWLRAYLLHCINNLKVSENLIHSRLNAIKFYFEQVLHYEKFFIEIPRPKKQSTVPKVLSKGEVKRLFDATNNTKHRLMLQLCYGMGLRVSEIVGLKVKHIDSERMQVLIAGAKGKKDRYVSLPESVLEGMRKYYMEYRPKEYLFEGQYGGQYAIRSVQAVFKNAMNKARINKSVGIHGLRHSYATHLLEYGTDMHLIQKLLGHKDVKTTQIYAKVSNVQLSKVRSPLDNLTN